MRRLSVFNNVSLDGYFTGPDGDLSWAKRNSDDAEWNGFVAGNARGGGCLIFGRVTYELMIRYWPTPIAKQNDPVVAERMNSLPKLVFSRTLSEASWNNTRLVRGGLTEEIRRLKSESGPDMVILGSGRIVSRLAAENLIDEFQLAVNPVILGRGRTMFEGLERPVSLKTTAARHFANGIVFLSYAPGP